MLRRTILAKQVLLVFCLMSLTTLKQCSGWDGDWVMELGAFHSWGELHFRSAFGLNGIVFGSASWEAFSTVYFLLNLALSLALFQLLGRVSFSESALKGLFVAYLLFQLALIVPITQAVLLRFAKGVDGVRLYFWVLAAMLTVVFHWLLKSRQLTQGDGPS